MRSRSYRRFPRRTAAVVLAVLVAGGWSPAADPPDRAVAADIPPQEPGVTMRVFDLQAPLKKLCELKAGQTPNVDKLMPVVDWSSDADFGLADRFMSQAIGYLDVPQDGSYDFRLISDDGSRLLLDGRQVIDHDGLHGAEPKDGTVRLSAGAHPLLIEHFEAGGGQQLTLQWKPPGATDFTLVPNSALSTDADVVRVTAPGRKECVSGQDSPGDGLPLAGVHPDYTLTDLRPAGFEPKVSAMDWLPDGRLAVSTWGESQTTDGEVYLLDNVTGATGPDQVTAKKVASGLREPMGIKYVDGRLYVSEKHQLTELRDTNRDEVTDEYRTLASWPYGGNFHEFAFGLLYDKGSFYLNLSVAINYGGATTDPQPARDRGTTVKVDKRTGKVSYLAGGLRTPNGIGWGPGKEILVTDNQGGWLPASKLVQIKKDRFFNHYTRYQDGATSVPGRWDDRPATKPVLWLPQNEIANSPSTPLTLKKGPFAGQILFGDVTYGGLQRASLEKVDGEYQGAVFRHTQGLEAGVNRISVGPDGAIYAGGLGAEGNWGQEGKLRFGLQKLTPNGTDAFDIHSMRATEDGFVLKYTDPLSQATVDRIAQNLPQSYEVRQWRYSPTPQYGGPKIDEEPLAVSEAVVSKDRTQVRLEIPGLRADRVVHLRSPRPFTAADGDALWSTEAWYTLNAVPGDRSTPTAYEAEEAKLSGGADVATEHKGYSGGGFVDSYGTPGAATTFHVETAKKGAYDVGLRYANGPNPFHGTKNLSLYVNGEKVRRTALPPTGNWTTWATHNERLNLDKGANTIAYRYDDGDDGHVNLDMLHLNPAGARIDLLDGGSLSQWQHTDGRAVTWPRAADDSIEVCCGDIRTKQSFGDHKLHVEFRVPRLPDDVTGQDRGNSGVYLQERYEIQILDSFGVPRLAADEAAAVYHQKAADHNASKAPETWQSYDLTFRAARYDSQGRKTEDARVTLVWNGVKVHDDVAVTGPTGGSIPEGAFTGSVRLQDHGNKVRFRTIWIQPTH
ncbi:family 16 glycoside hydrolase [Streptomyces sp. NPDC088789]|uniref:family 16 glycoside hydrolase n=1 Tax=Streptomyces sp. NPDC088789 TaxID=3365899 RepID=UPI003822A233